MRPQLEVGVVGGGEGQADQWIEGRRGQDLGQPDRVEARARRCRRPGHRTRRRRPRASGPSPRRCAPSPGTPVGDRARTGASSPAPTGVRRTGRRWRTSRPAAGAAWWVGGPDGPGPARRPRPPTRARRAALAPTPPPAPPWWSSPRPGPRRGRPAGCSRRTGRSRHRPPWCSGRCRGRRWPDLARSASSTNMTGTWSRCSAKPPGPSAAAAAMAGASASARRSSSRSVTAAHGVRPAADLGQVLVPPREVGVAQGPANAGVLDHDHPPRLPVPAVGGEAGGVEQPVDGVVGDLGR